MNRTALRSLLPLLGLLLSAFGASTAEASPHHPGRGFGRSGRAFHPAVTVRHTWIAPPVWVAPRPWVRVRPAPVVVVRPAPVVVVAPPVITSPYRYPGTRDRGESCAVVSDCAGGLACRVVADGRQLCLGDMQPGEMCVRSDDCAGTFSCGDRGDGWGVCGQ